MYLYFFIPPNKAEPLQIEHSSISFAWDTQMELPVGQLRKGSPATKYFYS